MLPTVAVLMGSLMRTDVTAYGHIDQVGGGMGCLDCPGAIISCDWLRWAVWRALLLRRHVSRSLITFLHVRTLEVLASLCEWDAHPSLLHLLYIGWQGSHPFSTQSAH